MSRKLTKAERSAINRRNGAKGGLKTAQKGQDFLIERSTKGGIAFLMKYGIDFYTTQFSKKEATA